ncbi:hypothetical protein KAR91_11975 [Candidatus Pacearchaeota archaeon]|nr:hypothetical protein [Candidatus Pacearchaeota archaeon]
MTDDLTPQEREQILAPLYKKVFFGQSTPQEGMMVFMDLLNFSETLRDVTETNATVYKHLGKRSVGIRILKMSEFTETDGSLGLKGISRLHVTIDDAARLNRALTEQFIKQKKEADNGG